MANKMDKITKKEFSEYLKSGKFAARVKESTTGTKIVASEDVKNILAPLFAEFPDREQVFVIYLTVKNKVISIDRESLGSIQSAYVYVREIAKKALEKGASAVILSHNHPFGDYEPSTEDFMLTKMVYSGLNFLEIELHDHVIVGPNLTFYSFADENHIEKMRIALKAFLQKHV